MNSMLRDDIMGTNADLFWQNTATCYGTKIRAKLLYSMRFRENVPEIRTLGRLRLDLDCSCVIMM
jgi:hypothetical protein